MFKKKKVEIDENKFFLDKKSMKAGKPDAKPPIRISRIIKTRLIILVAFIITVCVITSYLIYTSNKRNANTPSEIFEISNADRPKTYKLTNKSEWFYLNPLGCEKKYAQGENYELEYFEVEGLNDSKLQNQINNLIIKKENTIFDEVRKNYSNAQKYYVKAEVVGNFANILSIKLTIDIKVNSDQHIHGYKFITINLIDGNDIEIADVLNSNDIKIVLYEYGYKNLAEKYTKTFEIPESNRIFDSANAKELEEEAYQFVNDVVKHASHVTIGITSAKILITYPQNMKDEIYTRIVEIPLNEINGKEIVYNRYIGKDIYDLSYEKVGPFPVYMGTSKAYNVIYQKADNYFVDIVIEKNNDINKEDCDESLSKINDYMNKMLTQIKSKSANDKTRFYYLTAYVTIAPEGSNISANISGVSNNYLTKESFEKEVYPSFIKEVQTSTKLDVAYRYTPDVGSPTIINKNLIIDKTGNIVEDKDN